MVLAVIFLSEIFLHSVTIYIKSVLIAKAILLALRSTLSCWLIESC